MSSRGTERRSYFRSTMLDLNAEVAEVKNAEAKESTPFLGETSVFSAFPFSDTSKLETPESPLC
jgi:hypothetical protein